MLKKKKNPKNTLHNVYSVLSPLKLNVNYTPFVLILPGDYI